MEPFKAKKMQLKNNLSEDLIKMLYDTKELFGEYKGYLKNMKYDYKYFLDTLFVNELFYSFNIDSLKIEKSDMFFMEYKIKNNVSTEFLNLKRSFMIGLSESNKKEFDITIFNKMNRNLFLKCKKDNTTKGSGSLRKGQTFLLKPGLAGSSVAYVPPVYTEINSLMKDLCNYINNTEDDSFVALALTHYQFEKIHPYVSGNGVIGRILIPIQFSYYKHGIPLLFISESLYNLKNTYFTLLSENLENNENFIKFFLQCIMNQCNLNIKKIKQLNKVYTKDYESFKSEIGGTTIYKVYPVILRKVVFTTSDIVNECGLHINSVNKVLNKLVDKNILIKEKKNGTNRVTFCYKNVYDIFVNSNN